MADYALTLTRPATIFKNPMTPKAMPNRTMLGGSGTLAGVNFRDSCATVSG